MLPVPCARALAQDAEEALDGESVPPAGIAGEAGDAWQGAADVDGGGNVSHRFDVGLFGRLDPPARSGQLLAGPSAAPR